jgi:hypothetical protein
VEAIILDELDPEEPRLAQRLKEYMSPSPVTLNRKHRSPTEVEFRSKVFLAGSNHGPERPLCGGSGSAEQAFFDAAEIDERFLKPKNLPVLNQRFGLG